MKIKILYLDMPLEPPGGGQISLLLILKYLDRTKFEPVVFVPNECSFTRSLEKENISYKITPFWSLFFDIYKITPAIIHCNAPTVKYAFLSAVCSKLLKIPFIWHVRVIESAGWKDKLIGNLSTKIIVISDAVKSKFFWLKNNDKIVKICNSVDTEKYKPKLDIEYQYQVLNIVQNKKVIGIFSRIEPWKGHKLFLEAAKILSQSLNRSIAQSFVFLIVGDGPERKSLELRVESLELKDKVIFAGFRYDVPELMNLCDVVVNPSIEPEPFGRTIIEGMSCGKVVIATNLGGAKEIIEHNIDGVLVEPVKEKLANAILEIISNEKKRAMIEINARGKINSLFTLTKQLSALENLYIKTLEQHH